MSNDNKTLKVSQAESKRAVSIIGHLRQVIRAVVDENDKFIRPKFCDHADIVLASASLRALFFDDSPCPILIRFLELQELVINVECIETTALMMQFSELPPRDLVHFSDFLFQLLLDDEMKKEFPLDTDKPFISIKETVPKLTDSILKSPETWSYGREHALEQNSSVGYQPGLGFSEYASVMRRQVPLQQWGSVRLGFIKEIPITRKNIVCHVANKLGGVHYDPKRLPSVKNEAGNDFRVLTNAFDWNRETVTHAGIIATAVSCIEIARSPMICMLLQSLEQFHSDRQDRLIKGQLFEG